MEVSANVWICIHVTVILCSMQNVLASRGDMSWVFSRCKKKCLESNCTNQHRFYAKQPFYLRALRWECVDECKYSCMWKTVDAFQKDGLAIPQFHGKWPFVRVLGIQEPASVLFSVLNFLAHFMIFHFRRKVPPSAPMYYVWHGGALVGFNAWFWSIVFHTRDTDFTEKMDYFCAFSIVTYNLFGMLCRFLGTEKWWRPVLAGASVLAMYSYHIHYLGWVDFSYSYNMKANIFVGCCVLLGWLGWCVYTRRRHVYVWKCVVVLVTMNLLVMLELLDFPPFLWTIDAHSLWHAGTAPLGFLWYSFLTDDCLQLMKEKQESEKVNGLKKEAMKKAM